MTRGGAAVIIIIIIIEITCTIKVIKAHQALAHTVTPGVEDELEMQEEGSAQQALPEDAACRRPPSACAPYPIPGSRLCWRESRKQAGPRGTRPASAAPPTGQV